MSSVTAAGGRRYREQRLKARAAPIEVVRTALAGDVERFVESFLAVDVTCTWTETMRALARHQTFPPAIRAVSLDLWRKFGASMRGNTGDDRALVAALRVMLPPYEGGPLMLYRGQSMVSRRYRSYGCSWSTSREVAEAFAHGDCQTAVGGSVVLETLAPPAAVICAVHLHSGSYDYGEDEIIVDRRRLSDVKVVARFPQRPP